MKPYMINQSLSLLFHPAGGHGVRVVAISDDASLAQPSFAVVDLVSGFVIDVTSAGFRKADEISSQRN